MLIAGSILFLWVE